jgi:hypothetical protein
MNSKKFVKICNSTLYYVRKIDNPSTLPAELKNYSYSIVNNFVVIKYPLGLLKWEKGLIRLIANEVISELDRIF